MGRQTILVPGMTRVLIVHPLPTRGGFSAVVAQTEELLALGGFDVTVLVGRGARVDELPDGVRVSLLRSGLATGSGILQLRSTIRKQRPDILHLHGRKAGVIGRAFGSSRSAGTVLYTPHGTPWNGASIRRLMLNELLERLLLSRADRVLCVSRSEQADWVRRDSTERIVYFPNPVRPSSTTTELAHDRIPEGAVVVPSGYHPQKRLEVVLEALALMTKPRPNVVFCGTVDDAGYKQMIEGMARRLGVHDSTTFLANMTGITAVMRRAERVILPSFSEGMPIVGQEAVLAGANVLWSAIPPHLELFGRHSGEFWTPGELAGLMARPAGEFTVRPLARTFGESQASVRLRRQDFWSSMRGRPA